MGRRTTPFGDLRCQDGNVRFRYSTLNRNKERSGSELCTTEGVKFPSAQNPRPYNSLLATSAFNLRSLNVDLQRYVSDNIPDVSLLVFEGSKESILT